MSASSSITTATRASSTDAPPGASGSAAGAWTSVRISQKAASKGRTGARHQAAHRRIRRPGFGVPQKPRTVRLAGARRCADCNAHTPSHRTFASPIHDEEWRSPPRSPPHRVGDGPRHAASRHACDERPAAILDVARVRDCPVIVILPRKPPPGSISFGLIRGYLRVAQAMPQVRLRRRPSSRRTVSAPRRREAWHPRFMPLVALTGGIASGKSTIARRLAEHGAIVVDADQIVRDVQQPGSPVLDAIAAEFGERMLQPDGSLDRAALGARVFGDTEAVKRLNAIVHPAVRAESARRFAEALARATPSSSTTCRCSSRRARRPVAAGRGRARARPRCAQRGSWSSGA